MFKSRWGAVAVAVTMFAAGFGARSVVGGDVAHAQGNTRVFEMRTYTAAPGKFADLQKRFRDHTLRIFEKHGMTSIGYWVPADPPNSENTLVYIIAHKDRETAKKNWADFGADPEWQKVRAESMKDGVSLTTKVESVFLNPADYSPIK
jgi:hypothetical protein